MELNKEGKTIIMVTCTSLRLQACAKRQLLFQIRSSRPTVPSRKGGNQMQNLKFAFSSIMAHKMRSFPPWLGLSSEFRLSSSSWLWETLCLVRSSKTWPNHRRISMSFSLLSKARTAPLRRNNPLWQSVGEEDVHVEPPNTGVLTRKPPN